MGKQIRAGTVNDIYKREGEWLFVDLGFAEKTSSCGVLKDKYAEHPEKDAEQSKPQKVTFGELVNLVKGEAQQNVLSPLNLVLEAPLSVTFNQFGNPTPRACDIKDGNSRSWHRQPAPGLIMAAGYLLRALADHDIERGVRLYEGFVSFKPQGSKSSHTADVEALRNAVWNQTRCQIFDPTEFKQREDDNLESAFGFMGMDFGIPPVIRPDNDL